MWLLNTIFNNFFMDEWTHRGRTAGVLTEVTRSHKWALHTCLPSN